jgi:peptide/nickel transport system permease protein
LREQEYMVAADALGYSSTRKIFRHLVPNVMPQLIVSMTLGLGSVILTESSLSFLGLGVPSTLASLGQMVSLATKDTNIMQYYIADWLPAGLIIIIAVLAFNFIGDGLRDALDPKMKR